MTRYSRLVSADEEFRKEKLHQVDRVNETNYSISINNVSPYRYLSIVPCQSYRR